MRVCRITSAFPPPWEGLGPGPYELSAAQAELGHEVTVITKYADGCGTLDREAPFEVRRIRTGRNLLFGFLAALEFSSLHRRRKYDIIHSHGDSAVPILLLRRLFPRVPVVSSVHIVRKAQFKALGGADMCRTFRGGRAGINGGLPGVGARFMELWKESLYIKRSDALAAVSESLKDDILSEYGMVRSVSVVFNGVNTVYFDPACREVASRRLKKELGCNPLLLFVGVLNMRKGEFDLIEAMKTVAVEYPDSKLLIIGDGPTKKLAMGMASDLGLAKKIVFVSGVSRSRMVDFYAASDLFVLPSYSEGLPKVLLEAMACGKAAVVSDIPAHREVIRNSETGYLFKAGDVESLSATLLAALQSRERRERVAKEARTFIMKHRTWHSVARRLDRIYDDCKR